MFHALKILIITVGFIYAQPAWAALQVFACEPEWAALTKELGANDVDIYTATTGMQDPHQIEARPSLIAKARKAELLICTGAELEVGWLPQVLRQAANAKVLPGQPGHFSAADFVKKLKVPTQLDRSLGDVHAEGNPHVQTDPRNILQIANELAKRLAQLDTAHAADYQQRYNEFSVRLQKAIAGWELRAAALKGKNIIVQHENFAYLSAWLGLHEIATLEPKPGVEPTTAHLAEVLEKLKQQPAHCIIRTTYHDPHAGQWLAEHSKLPVLALPGTVGGSDQATDLFRFFDELVTDLLKVAK